MTNYFEFLNQKSLENIKERNVGMGRLPWPQFNAFRPFVLNELNRRKNTYPTVPVSPFVRLTSTKKDISNNYQFFTLGLHGFDKSDINLFDEIQGGNKTDVVGYAYDLIGKDENGKMRKKLIYSNQLSSAERKIFDEAVDQLSEGNVSASEIQSIIGRDVQDNINTINTIYAKGTHPTPGITSAKIARRGIGTSLVVTITWKCYNRAQLEFLRNHFLVVGGYVVFEWGNQFADKKINNMLDFSDESILPKLKDAVKNGRKNILKDYNAPNAGNYDIVVGIVGNFKIDMEASTGAYICTTTLVTPGEEMWGLSSQKTRVNGTSELNIARPTSIYEYFYSGGKFDQLLEQYRTDPKLVADYKQQVQIESNDTATGLQQSSIMSEDVSFISWEFFSQVLVKDIFSIINDAEVKNTLHQYMEMSGTDFVGNSKFLRSTNPDTMILVKKEFESSIPEGFKGASFFDYGDITESNQPANEERGRLAQGVWLNTNMVRQAFALSNNFEHALATLLSNMNNAVANYWKLQIYFDDDTNQYKIADGNYIDITRLDDSNSQNTELALYKFNRSKRGELLSLAFDSAFPKELITQMMLSARFLSMSPEEQSRLIKEYPLLGTTALYVFALNWTSLEDVLKTSLDSDNVEERDFTDPRLNPQSTNAIMENDNSIRISNRIMSDATNVGGNTAYTPQQRPGQNPAAPPILTPDQLFGPNRVASTSGVQVILGIGQARKNNNPGNLQYNRQPGASAGTPHPSGGFFARFETPLAGYLGLLRDIEIKKSGRSNALRGKPNATLRDFIEVYAPKHENDTELYIRQAVESLRKSGAFVTENTRLRDVDTNVLGKFLAWKESQTRVIGEVTDFSIFNFSFQRNQPIAPTPETRRNSPRPVTPVRTIANMDDGDYIKKFGQPIRNMIETNPSDMIARITQNGLNSAGTLSNSFVAPFPTTTSIQFSILGIAGMSISDGFYVDKLPFLFEKHGCFQITEVSDAINPNGWVTTVRGYFKLLWIDGRGPKPTPI